MGLTGRRSHDTNWRVNESTPYAGAAAAGLIHGMRVHRGVGGAEALEIWGSQRGIR